MQSGNESPIAGLDALNSEFDEALGLLRGRRYAELDEHLHSIEAQAGALADSGALSGLRDALDDGSVSDDALRERCATFGQRLDLLSAVARQVVEVELGIAQIVENSVEGSYGRDGQCGEAGPVRIQQEA